MKKWSLLQQLIQTKVEKGVKELEFVALFMQIEGTNIIIN